MRRACPSAVFALVLLFAFTQAAGSAASGWVPAVLVPDSHVSPSEAPSVAMNARGDAVVAWTQKIRDSAGVTTTSLQAVYRAAGGAFGPASVLLHATPASGTAQLLQPVTAVTPDGTAIVAWWYPSGPPGRNGTIKWVDVAVRPAGGSWSAPVRLSQRGNGAVGPALAVDERGNAILAWRSLVGGISAVEAQERLANGTWLAVKQLGTDVDTYASLGAGFVGNGRPIVAWDGGSPSLFHAAIKSAGRWSSTALTTIPTAPSGGDLISLAATTGRALVAWTDRNGIEARSWTAPGGWAPVQQVAKTRGFAYAAVQRNGNAFVGYESGSSIFVATRTPGSSWTVAKTNTAKGDFDQTGGGISVDPRGDLAISWYDVPAIANGVALLPAGGTSWITAKTPLVYTGAPAIDSEGDALVAGSTIRRALGIVEYKP